jgi:alpha-1,2-mannosyltransferase
MPTVRSGELTPAQHRLIRQQIALIPLYVWVIYAWGVFYVHLPVPPLNPTSHIARDFVHFYSQGVITLEHDRHALYDIDAMAAVVERVVPVPVEMRFPPVYGPQVGLFFAGLAWLPYKPAMLVWFALTIIGYAVCMNMIWRAENRRRRWKWMAVVFALGAPGLHFTLSFGQASLIGLVCFTAMWLWLRSGRPFLAGLAVGALAYKPQLGIVAAFVFLLAHEWRVVFGAVTAVVVQFGAGLIYWGPGIFPEYIGALLKLPDVIATMEPDKAMMHSWRAFFLHLGIPSTAALALSIATSAVTIAAAVICWRKRGDLAPRYVVLVLATLLVDPHIYAYDLLLLVPALLVGWDWAGHQPETPVSRHLPAWTPKVLRGITLPLLVRAMVVAVYIAPILTIGLTIIPVQWSVVTFILLGGILVRHSMSSVQSAVQPHPPEFRECFD